MAGIMNKNGLFPFAYRNSVGTWGNLKDFNLATGNGWYNVSGTTAEGGTAPSNSPVSGGYGIMLVLSVDATVIQCFFGAYNESAIMYRIYSGGSWGSWRAV